MKIAVFGATGPLGREVVRVALSHGYDVVVLVRNPDKFSVQGELTVPEDRLLTVAKIDLNAKSTIRKHLEGIDGVISCLGATDFLSYFYCTLYSDSIETIVDSMLWMGVKRLIVVSSWCTSYDRKHPAFIEWFMKPFLIGALVRDMRRMENYLHSKGRTTDLRYTAVRLPGLTKQPRSTRAVQVYEGQWVPTANSFQMPRANVAEFLMECLEKSLHKNKCVAISI